MLTYLEYFPADIINIIISKSYDIIDIGNILLAYSKEYIHDITALNLMRLKFPYLTKLLNLSTVIDFYEGEYYDNNWEIFSGYLSVYRNYKDYRNYMIHGRVDKSFYIKDNFMNDYIKDNMYQKHNLYPMLSDIINKKYSTFDSKLKSLKIELSNEDLEYFNIALLIFSIDTSQLEHYIDKINNNETFSVDTEIQFYHSRELSDFDNYLKNVSKYPDKLLENIYKRYKKYAAILAYMILRYADSVNNVEKENLTNFINENYKELKNI
jgi:hypothetical protein